VYRQVLYLFVLTRLRAFVRAYIHRHAFKYVYVCARNSYYSSWVIIYLICFCYAFRITENLIFFGKNNDDKVDRQNIKIKISILKESSLICNRYGFKKYEVSQDYGNVTKNNAVPLYNEQGWT
jgi:hypothetical protein